jgi:hypothetical protein
MARSLSSQAQRAAFSAAELLALLALVAVCSFSAS